MTAQADWERRIGRRGLPGDEGGSGRLSPPSGLRAVAGGGHVTLDWDPAPGAAGYLVYRAETADGPFEPLDHGGGDVLAVPGGPYADTSGEPGRVRYYAVAAVTDGTSAGPRSEPIAAVPGAVPGSVTVEVGGTDGTAEGSGGVGGSGKGGLGEVERPWEVMIGSEHLSYMLRRDTTGGQVIGTELREALRIAHDEFGVRAVRAHGILCDDLGVYTEADGRAVHDFSGIDRVYDALMRLGLRPVVELSFMPRDLARDPGKTVFTWEAIISPPRDWDRWADLVRDLAEHLVERYGREEVVSRWAFEVWNEPNLEVFWSGTAQEYFRLYDVSAAAIRAVDPRLRVGGPASAAAGWISEFLDHVRDSGAPADFLSTHVYGNVPLDLRPVLADYGLAGTPTWWTEWGPTPTHFHRVGDTVFAAAFLLRGMASAMGRIEALSHWVASDHFEELGAPPELFHGGFGLLSVGNLRKPRYWALHRLARLGRQRLPVRVSGDGAGGLVEAIAARGDDGRISILVWNVALDQRTAGSNLDRQVRVQVAVPAGVCHTVRHYRIDADHSNIAGVWESMSGEGKRTAWPDDKQWALLREANTLDELVPAALVAGADGSLEFTFDLPMPSVSCLELVP